jgi:nucleotide-binding universal stress UspA family protein
MSLLAHTVVGVDGSPGSERALAWAVAQAGDGEITAVHAFPPLRPLLASAVLINLDPVRAEHARLLHEDWIAEAKRSRVPIHPVLIDDYPASALRAVAKRVGDVPIIVGHQGHGRWSLHQVGAVANRLLHAADVPVIMTTERTTAEPLSGTVAVAVHGPVRPTHEPVAWAVDLAIKRSLNVHILSVTQPFALAAGYDHPEELLQIDFAAVHRANVAATNELVDTLQAENPDTDFSGQILQGHPTEMLGDAICDLDPALVVVGNYHHSRLASIITDSVSRHLPTVVDCPVVAIPTK